MLARYVLSSESVVSDELFDRHNLITSRTYAKHGNRALNDALQLLDVGLHGCRQFLEGTAVGDILIKAVELLVNRLTVYQIHEVCRELGNGLAVLQLVGYADLELRQAAQRSILLITTSVRRLHEPHSVQRLRRTSRYARTAGNSTELAACIADVVAGLVEQLGRERTLAYTGSVGLKDTHDLIDGSRADTGTDAAAACYRMRRR